MKSPRASSRPASSTVSRNRHRVSLVAGSLAVIIAAASCSSDSTAPDPLAKIPDFIYVSNATGAAELYTWHHGTSTPFPATAAGDIEPQSAAGKVVFTSYRISGSNPEIFIATIGDTAALRLTTQSGTDRQPSLSPNGATVVFASSRTGTSRIWTMGADGSNPTEFNTGAGGSVPESGPRFSPDGNTILFSSPRSNTNQMWIIPAAGGTATQVTHEANGAFSGSWSADGNSIFYVDGTDRTKIHNVVVSSGAVTDYVTGGTDVGDPACTSQICLVETNATSVNRDILAYIGAADTMPIPLLNGTPSEYQPAILHP